MKNIRMSAKLLLMGVIAVSVSSLDAKVTVSEVADVLSLENSVTKIEYALDKGVFNIYNKSDESLVVREAVARVNETRSSDWLIVSGKIKGFRMHSVRDGR